MKLADTKRIAAPRSRVYEALNEPDILARCIPGCESVTKLSDTEMEAVVVLKVGPMKAKFSGSVRLEDLDPPAGYTITGEGRAPAAGLARGSTRVRLEEDGDATLLSYEVDVSMSGKIAQFGARLMEATSRKLAGEFFDTFGSIVEQDEVAGPEGSAAASGGAGAEAAHPPAPDAPAAPDAPDPKPASRPRWLVPVAALAAAAVAVLAYWLVS